MTKQLFLDMLVAKPTILDSAEDGKLRIRFKATQANVINSNRRLYPLNVLKDAVEASNALIAENRMVGESPHPKHFVGKDGQIVFDSSVENSVIKIYNQFIDADGTVYVDAEVLGTAKGKDLKALVDAVIPVGISMRALGDSTKKQISNVMVDVATKLDIKTYDVVMNPATTGCEVVEVLTDSQVAEVLADDVQITIPACPSCSATLTPQDPDGDGDLDFYSCESCKEVYIPEEEKSVAIRASQVLRKLPNDPDWDGYSLARQFKQSLIASDSQESHTTSEGDEDEVKIEDILKAMKDRPEFKELVAAEAKTIAQPALDAVQAQTQAAEAARAAETAKAETKTFVDGRLAELKGKVTDEVISVISDSVKDATSKESAGTIIDSVINIYSKAASRLKLDGMGFDGTTTGAGGAVRVEVTHEPKPWSKSTKDMLDAIDRVREEYGHESDPSIRKVNQKFVDEVIGRFESQTGFEAMKDSAAWFDSQVANTDSVSVTTAQLLNQPSIQAALIIQSFQDVESLQFIAAETIDGNEARWPVETFTSAAVVNPTTGLSDLLVAEGAGIPESAMNLAWLTFNPDWRRNAISLTMDAVKTLKSGPAKYDAIARAIYHIGFDKRRKLDNLAYLEMCMAADEYAPKVITNEVPNPATNVTAVSNSTNVVYKYNLTVYKSSTDNAAATAGSNPIVRPRTKKQNLPSGQVQTVTSNPITIKVGASTLTIGYLDANGNIQSGDCAIDPENGIVYFAASAGLNPGAATPVLPSFSYSAVTNYDRWSYTVPGTTTADQYYNTLLQLITKETKLMGSAPRFNRPNLGIMSLNVAAYIENAAMWYKLNSPDIGSLSGLAESTYFGKRSGVNLAQINAPWVAGDNRILLTQKGATRYAIETPYEIEGPIQKYDPTTGNVVDAKAYIGRENSVMATPQTIDTNGNIINPKSRSIKIVQ